MKFWKFGLVACLLMLAGGCDILGFQNWRWHQRLTLEVETPEGVVTGGSVVAIYKGTTPKWVPGTGAGAMGGKVSAGEASFVEIEPGRYLFALLGEDMEDLAFDVFFTRTRTGEDREEMADQLEVLRDTREVPRERYPLLVTFDDIDDPATVKRVDPDDLAASFGPGVSLKRITLTITDEPVTEGEVEKVLGWLDDYYGQRLDGNRYGTIKASNRFANSLSAGRFDTER